MDDEKVTVKQLREKALKTLDESFDGYSIVGDEEGKQADGLASLYKEVMADDANRKASRWEIAGNILKGLAGFAIACVNVYIFRQATAKESDEILDTQTKQTVARNSLMGRWLPK